MKVLVSLILLLSLTVNAIEFNYKNVGTFTRNEITKFPGGGKFVAFKHSRGLETDIGKYGNYQCNRSIL